MTLERFNEFCWVERNSQTVRFRFFSGGLSAFRLVQSLDPRQIAGGLLLDFQYRFIVRQN